MGFQPTRRRAPELCLGEHLGRETNGFIVEDDGEVQRLFEEALFDGGSEPAIAASGEERSLCSRAALPTNTLSRARS